MLSVLWSILISCFLLNLFFIRKIILLEKNIKLNCKNIDILASQIKENLVVINSNMEHILNNSKKITTILDLKSYDNELEEKVLNNSMKISLNLKNIVKAYEKMNWLVNDYTKNKK